MSTLSSIVAEIMRTSVHEYSSRLVPFHCGVEMVVIESMCSNLCVVQRSRGIIWP